MSDKNKNDNDKKSLWAKLLEPETLREIAPVIVAIGGVVTVVGSCIVAFCVQTGRCQPTAPTPTIAPIETETRVPPTPTIAPTVPTDTPAPIVTPTVPTHTPPPPPTPVERPIESFEWYGSDEALQAAYSIDAPENDASVSLAGGPYAYDGTQALEFTYDIQEIVRSADGTLTDFAGLTRALPSQDWRGFGYLRLWVKSDASSRSLVIQFHEASGEVWNYTTNLSRFDDEDMQLPLDTSRFQHAKWSPWVNGQIDLGAVVGYSIYVGHGGEGQGTIYIDAIRLSK